MFRTRYVSVRVCASSHPHIRVGLIVPRFGRTAVDRNRLKRRFREAIRLSVLPTASPADVLIMTLRRAYDMDARDVRDEVARVSQLLAET